MRTLFLTVSDYMFFPGTLAAVNSILRYHPEGKIAVVSSGLYNHSLNQRQIAMLQSVGVSVFPHDFYEKPGRVLGAWQLKAYAANDLSKDNDMIVGFDSDLILCAPVYDVIQDCMQDGKFRGGKDEGLLNKGSLVYGKEYGTYGFDTPATNPVYMSTSLYFCPLTDENRVVLRDWSEKSDFATYGPQEKKIYPGYGDQGVLNAVIYAHTRSRNVELLPNRLWSQHHTFKSDVIGFDGCNLVNLSMGGAQMRSLHSTATPKFWTAKHSEERRSGLGLNQRWSYAAFLDFLFLGEGSVWNFDPNEVIPQRFSHLYRDFVYYHQLVNELHPKFSERWRSIGWNWIQRCCKSNSVRRMMPLNGNGSMDKYINLAEQVPDGGICVEVGSYVGGSVITLALALLGRHIRCFSVESFMGNNNGTVDGLALPGLDEFIDNVSVKFPFLDVFPVQLPSTLACARWGDRELDLVFIDGNHSRDSVAADIDLWREKIKPGGILAGDDFEWRGVSEAVLSRFSNVESGLGIWWIIIDS
jgi:predicted O-methyltransferase YrrM